MMHELMTHQLIDYRMPVPYQYSALRQFDNDPDDDVVDPEHSLNMMVEDTSSDEEEIIGNGNHGNSTSSKTIGAIDIDPPDANAVIKFTNFSLLDFCIFLPILNLFSLQLCLSVLRKPRQPKPSNLDDDEVVQPIY